MNVNGWRMCQFCEENRALLGHLTCASDACDDRALELGMSLIYNEEEETMSTTGPCLTLTESSKGFVMRKDGTMQIKMFVINKGSTQESINDRLAKLKALGWRRA